MTEASIDKHAARADEIVGRAVDAAEAFLALDQASVDAIVDACATAAFEAREDLARLDVERTGIGVVEDKAIKIGWSARAVREDIAGRRTVGVLSDDPETGITVIARPRGPVLAITPVTNPVSTTVFKTLICMKTRNPVIFSPHRGAKKASLEAVRLLADVAVAAGAPADAIQAAKGSPEVVAAVLGHPGIALIVASGSGSIVRAAQASGTPCYGVGPGNVPVYVHASADLEAAADAIFASKTFDHGTVCASEQAVVVLREIEPRLRALFEARGARFVSDEEAARLGEVAFDSEAGAMRAAAVGRSAEDLARSASIDVPAGTRILVGEPGGVGPDHPLSHEILTTILAWYPVDDHEAAVATCRDLVRLGGIGHTAGIHASDDAAVRDLAERVDVGRIVVNSPCTQGALGGFVNALTPSLTLTCGAGAGNILAGNLSIDQLIEPRRIIRPSN